MKNLKDMLNESRGDIDKDIAKKARELIEEIYPSTSMGDYGLKEMLVLSAMEWMKSYMIENTCEWLKENCRDYSYDDYNNTAYIHITDLIEDFRKEIEE